MSVLLQLTAIGGEVETDFKHDKTKAVELLQVVAALADIQKSIIGIILHNDFDTSISNITKSKGGNC